ncbi:MBL fold metallo-hydrolase [Candidatus Sulfurimonas baltica]|uniref:MBL fold metallo-hydrolase n=1 Tax=Candidatus Sulfurimonas baltica TaxID=2740404 RepID=A0A7S7LVH3_9BACT|nr:MBL fold metallo-hydrolase [Candidatus Sulfurimonas baltica]QOY52075.1 MBL fold metallo-hydrolase [Candidatus Sulfurimonas baltica]
MIKKMINPLVVSAIALLPMMTACSDATAESASAATTAAKVVKSDEFDYKLKPKQVSENVWCFFGAIEAPTKENAGNMANNCYVKTDDSFVVFDTGPSFIFAKQAYDAMSKVAGPLPVKVVVNSHEHDDHWLGNDFYKQTFGAELIGPSIINKKYKAGDQTRMYRVLPKNAIAGTNIIPVDRTLTENYKFNLKGIDFEVITIGVKAHTAEDYFLFMPKSKVLFAGDLVMNGRITSGRDGAVLGQIKALDMIDAKGWETLIPGHGFITDKTAVNEARDYFTFMRDRVAKAIEDGVDAADIQGKVPMIEFKEKAMYDILHNNNLDFAYQEIEMM